MGDHNPQSSPNAETDTAAASISTGSGTIPPPPPLPRPQLSLVQPSRKKKYKHIHLLRIFRSVFRSFPIISPLCKFPHFLTGHHPDGNKISGSSRITGTLFGFRRGKVTLSLQQDPKCLPMLVVELAIATNALQKEIASGMVRIALECDKRLEKDKTKLMEEPLWTMYFNGKTSGYGVKREASAEDLYIMEVLKMVSMGTGVLPGNAEVEEQDDELAYMRAHFERVVGSKDSETFYMLSPNGDNGPELSIFFVRI